MSNQPKKSDKRPNLALRYTGMAFQMVIIIGIGVFIGQKMDAYWELDLMTPLFALIALGIAFYVVLKDLNRQ